MKPRDGQHPGVSAPPLEDAAANPPLGEDAADSQQSVLPASHKTADESDPARAAHADDTANKWPPIFENWPKPVLTLFFSGRQHGYIEPCGCTGLMNQKGGMNRRHVLYRQLADKGFNPVAIDAGNQVRRFGRQPEIKFQSTISGMKKIGYAAIAFGPDDLKVSTNELLAAAVLETDGGPAPFVSANVNVLDAIKPYRIVEKAGKKIGITAVLGKDEARKISNDEIALKDPDAALAEIVPKLTAEKCDLYVLLAHTSIDESKRLARKFKQFHLIATTGGAGEPAHRLQPIEDAPGQLVQVGAKGMHVSVVGLFDDRENPLRLQRVPLDGRFPDSKEMLALMAAYQQQLEAMGLEGLAVKPKAHPSGRKFVGSKACADCHSDEYEIWQDTPHSHATESLVHPGERSDIPRHHDPECLSCHVTGWNPQEFYPYQSGYLSLKGTPHLTTMGCENCHGPGSLHVAAENGDIDVTADVQEQYQKQMVLKLKDARETCLKCHDLDNSPDFHEKGAFEEYWEQIEH